MKAVLFLIGFAGVIFTALYGMQILPALAAGGFDFHAHRTQVLGAGGGAIIALFCFGKAMATKKVQME
jgi:hypothetical protein